jgi:hypothetical protein
MNSFALRSECSRPRSTEGLAYGSRPRQSRSVFTSFRIPYTSFAAALALPAMRDHSRANPPTKCVGSFQGQKVASAIIGVLGGKDIRSEDIADRLIRRA